MNKKQIAHTECFGPFGLFKRHFLCIADHGSALEDMCVRLPKNTLCNKYMLMWVPRDVTDISIRNVQLTQG